MGIQQALLGQSYGDYITLTNVNVTDAVADPANANAGYRLDIDGIVYTGLNGTFDPYETWIYAAGNAGLYEVFVTVNSGSLSGGTSGSWLNLGTARTWFVSRGILGISSANITLQIRTAATGIVQATATVNLEADVG